MIFRNRVTLPLRFNLAGDCNSRPPTCLRGFVRELGRKELGNGSKRRRRTFSPRCVRVCLRQHGAADRDADAIHVPAGDILQILKFLQYSASNEPTSTSAGSYSYDSNGNTLIQHASSRPDATHNSLRPLFQSKFWRTVAGTHVLQAPSILAPHLKGSSSWAAYVVCSLQSFSGC